MARSSPEPTFEKERGEGQGFRFVLGYWSPMRPCLKTNRATIQQCTSPGLGCVTDFHKCLWVSHKCRRRLGGLPRSGNSCGQFLAVPFCLLCFPVNLTGRAVRLDPALLPGTCHPPPMSNHFTLKKQSLLPYSPGIGPQCRVYFWRWFLWYPGCYILIHSPSPLSVCVSVHTLPPRPLSQGCHGHCVLLLPTLSSLLCWLAHLPFWPPFLICMISVPTCHQAVFSRWHYF